ncbi:MAG: hypothetical protein IJY28_00390 [Clostridia bacterium]|nr:hypothetical protein [Clostridia bacterium]
MYGKRIVYNGFGAQRGIRVDVEDGLAYAAAHPELLNDAERAELRQMVRTGITAGELEEWYFSGSFRRVEEV